MTCRRSLLVLSLLPALLPKPVAAQTVAELTARLAAADAVEDEVVSDQPSLLFQHYRRLLATATVAELRALTRHEAPVVRCYAVRGLADLGAVGELPAILRAHAADVAKVEVRSGCERYTTPAGDFMFDVARPKLAAEQVLDLGEHLVRTGSPLYARQWALRNLRFRDGMLHAIRKLAEDGEAPAAIALARYRIGKDVPTLIEHLHRPEPFADNCAFLAAEVSHDAQLLPALVALGPAATRQLERDNAQRLRFWLAAIVAQQGTEAAAFLLEFLRTGAPAAERQRDLARTFTEVLGEQPAAVFAEVRAEVRRLLPDR